MKKHKKEFVCGVALESLLARHPRLRDDSEVAALLEHRENGIVENRVLQVVQDLVIRPDVGLAALGCFRPILPRVLDTLVQSLRQLWRQGRGPPLGEGEGFIGISTRLRSGGGWDLGLHEYACIMFSRLLDLAPYLLSSFLQYFEFAPPPYERLLHEGVENYQSMLGAGEEQQPLTSGAPAFCEVVYASYRLLQLESTVFRELWDWSPFLDLLRSSPKNLDDEASLDVRWCGVQIVSQILQMSDKAVVEFRHTVAGLIEEDCFGCHIRWRSYCQNTAVEKLGMYLEKPDQAQDQMVVEDGPSDWSLRSVKGWKGANNSFHLQVCGIDLPVRQDLREGRAFSPARKSLVLTPTVKRNLEAVVLALSQRCPVLLEGPIGSGKSSLIQELANLTGNLDVLFIHLDDQMDSKTLLGNYACTEIPGEFKWQPGALTQAVAKGMWVVFEDIDRAPFEILSALIPLLEDRKLYIPGRGEMVPAADNFRFFSTVTRTRHRNAFAGGKKEMLGNLWRKVVIDAPNDEELADIIRIRFPSLSLLVPKLIGTFNLVLHMASQSERPADGLPDVSVYVGRQFSTRDLFKWCTRIISSLGSQIERASVLSSSAREWIYVEAADCFGASIAKTAERHLALSVIGRFWNVPVHRVGFLSSLNKPSIQKGISWLQVGRVGLLCQPRTGNPQSTTRLFANTGHAVRTLETIAMCVEQQEPVLLVGETGTGKTSVVQHLAWQLGMNLIVLNMSQQTDSADFLGGYKPVEAQGVCIPLLETFNALFQDTFSKTKNADLLQHVQRFAEKRKWDRLLKSFRTVIGTVSALLGASFDSDVSSSIEKKVEEEAESNGHSVEEQSPPKRKRPLNSKLLNRWRAFTSELRKAERQVEAANTGFAFSFVEGVLVKAIREGHWLLLDEVNLAPVETLERLTGILEGAAGSLSLTERGDVENVPRHPNFRIFACMNPATDFGKRDLPISLRNRFTELYIDELTQKEDLQALVFQYLQNSVPSPPVENIVRFYLKVRDEAGTKLLDGANQKPQYSLRSLARALEYTCAAMSTYGFLRSLYDGICMSFLTLLDQPSALIMEHLINDFLFKTKGPDATKDLKALFKVPPQPSPAHVLVEHIWVESGNAQPSRLSLESRDRYVLTKSIVEHLKNLARAVFVRKYPVLLQGPTSSGKTSLVEYLATITGHRFVRINNHEHTDLQEYLGSYVTDSSGKLVFQEGALVEAVRKGYWIVLDELNLAPSDVLEALNRLLDDNRELFVPELQLTVKPHPHFMLFATQNPPGIYGGRKVLSRAFRNRFMELHIDDIPDDELCVILDKRCQIPGSYAAKMIEVMKVLQRHRQGSKVFAGKHGFITARDLFRWAERHGNGYEELARDGYMLLAERLRKAEQKKVVQKVLEQHMRVKLDVDLLHDMQESETFEAVEKLAEAPEHVHTFGRIVWTKSMKRLFNLVEHCVRHCEPVLLVGETGCGKTMVCQLLSLLYNQRLHILNCHQHSETSDFLGGFRPVRDRDSLAIKFQKAAERIASMELFQKFCSDKLPVKVEDSGTTLTLVKNVLSELKKRKPDKKGKVTKAAMLLEEALKEISTYQREWQSLFVWHDGPLVQAMRNGDMFLVDEISLAEDSVLERLNSVLEPKRLLVLAEKGGGADVEELIANPSFRILATMNPGGDFGKKELSPALRNRFTEVWVPPINDVGDLRSIAVDRFSKPDLVKLVDPMLEFWQWFQHHYEGGRSLSVRDLLAWITYINVAEPKIGEIPAFIHGAFLVLLDGIGFGLGLSNSATQQLQTECAKYLFERLPEHQRQLAVESTKLSDHSFGSMELDPMEVDTVSGSNLFGIRPFYIARGDYRPTNISFALDAPTTKRNAWRILRAMQLHKPVLIEGSPGVGKTSLVTALAAASGHALVRMNLSEQTDIMDLLGSDMPVEGGTGAEFQWSDGVFLQALKAGHWVLLDELNLASQSVLEGLNACLDHRGELFIPELGRSFKCPSTFRVFACQNPLSQGGGRKGLPKSFLNRFTKVYVEALSDDDFLEIASILHPSLSKSILKNMIEFNSRLHQDTMVHQKYGHSGSPWEFNLRDILRWCELVERNKVLSSDGEAQSSAPEDCSLDVIYLQRMRTIGDRRRVLSLFQEVFDTELDLETFPAVSVLPEKLQVGRATLPRRNRPRLQGDFDKQLQILPGLANRLEAAMHCVSKGWMCILVGRPATGKTSLVRLMAALTGNSLHEFTLSSATDTTELLGCFEQHDLFRRWQEIVKLIYDSLKTVCSFCLSDNSLQADLKTNLVKSLFGSWAAFQKMLRGHVTTIEQEFDQAVVDPVVVNMLLQFLDQLRQTVTSCGMPMGDPELDPHQLYQRVAHLKSSFGQLGTAGRFEWVDGGLLKAIERGDWVVLENANFCNPTVLDRLNPLLEPGGSIVVNERGLVEGEAMVVHAHPNFRLFLTVDPAHGEVSRAMRNRGIELFMLQPDWPQSATIETPVLEEFFGGLSGSDLDSLKILIQAGVPGPALLQGMCRAHIDVRILTEVTHSGLPISLRELYEWVSLLQQLLERGGTLSWSLACSWEQVYSRRLDNVEARQDAMEKFHSRLGSVNLLNAGNWKQVACTIPGGWPSPVTFEEYCLASKEAVVLRDSAFLEYLAAQLSAFKSLRDWPLVEDGQSELLQRFEGTKSIAAHLPASLLHCVLNPEQPLTTDNPLSEEKTQDLDSILLFASLWMLEQGSYVDINLRMQWLRHFANCFQGSLDGVKRVVAAIERETAHPLSKELSLIWEKCLQERENHHDVSTFSSLVSGFVSQGSKPSSMLSNLELREQKGSLRELIFMATRLQVLRKSLLQWGEEDEQYRMTEKLGCNSSSGPFMQSYWHHNHRAERSRLSSAQYPRAMLIYLHPLFSALREFENRVLLSSCSSTWESMVGSFSNVQEWHEALWKHLSRSKFDTEGFLFHWNSLKRSLQALASTTNRTSESVVKAVDEVHSLVKLIDEPFSLGENPLARPLLWKYAGHPGLPHSKEVHDLELKVLRICEDLWQRGGNEEMITISNDINIRQLTSTGLSIIRWLGQDAVAGTEVNTNAITPDGGATASTSYSEALAIYQMLKERVQLGKTDVSPLGDHDIIPSPKSTALVTKRVSRDLQCVSFPKELLQWPSARALWAELLPWLSNVSICQDIRLIAEVSRLAGVEHATEESLPGMLKNRISETTLNRMIEFAISCSSRSPADLVPHQHLLWLLDGIHPSKSGILPAIRDVSHELVYRWHSALWMNMLTEPIALEDWGGTMGPARIFYASQTVQFSSLLGRTGAIRDYFAKLTQLRLASVHVWAQAKQTTSDVFVSNLCCASAIFQQIICAHGKSFREDEYKALVNIFSVLHSAAVESMSGIESNLLGSLATLLMQSQHAEFLKLVEPLITPCMKILYSIGWKNLSFSKCLMNLGRVWLYLGELRLRLLLPSDGCDPVAKYSHKHAHLTSHSTLLDLDIKIGQESEFLVRGSRHSPKTQNLLVELEETKQELSSLSLKLVPRPEPPQFRNFLDEVLQFMKSSVDNARLSTLASDLLLVEGRGARTLDEVSTWQENAMHFIHRLASDFPAYRDVVQPVQLAVYELKFGLSMLQAGYVQGELFFDNDDASTGENNFLELLSTLMQFPTVRSDLGHKISASCTELVTSTTEAIISKVACSLLSGPVQNEVLDLELKVMVMRVAILRCGIDTQQTRVKAKDVVKAVNNIFASLASLWSEIRERQMAKKKEEDEFIRFTARTHTLETEDEIEEASFREMFADFKAEFPGYDDDADDTGMLSAEFDDKRAEAVLKENEKAAEDAKQRSDKAWLKIQEPLIQDVVSVHRHMFGRKRTILNVGQEEAEGPLVSDWDRENAFSLAYQTGVRLLGAVGHRVSAQVEDSLIASHIMQVGIEHKRVSDLRQSRETRSVKYNIYKDPNPPEMALMLEPLRQFLERVNGLLAEWPEHPILTQFLNIAKALVGISVEAPIMKALTGVELLLSKAQLWEENSAKHVSLAGEMMELMKLVRRWRKLELESWPVLLECTREKHEQSAERLWFFLHGLLHRQLGEDFDKEMEATFSSLEEFMQTSPLGEFSRRLDLLRSFHGQFLLEVVYGDDSHAGASRTAVQKKLCNILYNVREYYSEFLPAVEEAVTIGKAPIEKELKGFAKLTKWEDRGYYALALSAEKTHRKLHKLIRKYDELLKKPVLEVILKQASRMGAQPLATLTTPSEPAETDVETTEKSVDIDTNPVLAPVPVPEPVRELSASRASVVITAWNQFCGAKVTEVTLMASGATLELADFQRLPSLTSRIGDFLGVGVFAPENRKIYEDCVRTLEDLGITVIERSAELRKGEKRLSVKKKALIDLLRALRDIGLSHHKSAVPKDERNVNSWFQQPGSDSAEMLMMLWAHQDEEVVPGLSSVVSIDTICSVWSRAKHYYFQNVALLQRLRQNALDFNKALSLREVEVSTKYMEHLVYLQRKQRLTAFDFSSKLSSLVHLTSLLSGFTAENSRFPRQGTVRKLMWLQKGLLDSLCHATSELALLYRTSEASQRSPDIDCTEVALISKAVLQISRKLEVCKNSLDGFLVPRSESVGSRPLEESWPLLITPSMQEVFMKNFKVLRTTETLLLEACRFVSGDKVPGLSSLQLLLSRALEMANDFEEEFENTSSSISLKTTWDMAPFIEHYNKIVAEIQLAVQNLRTNTGNSSAAQEVLGSFFGESELPGTVQDVDLAISRNMVALRLGKIYDILLKAICAGAEMIDSEHGNGIRTGAALGKLFGCIYAPLQILEAAGAQLLADFVYLQKTVSKLGYILSNLFCSLYSDGFCLTKEQEGEAGGTKFEDADGTGMGEGQGQKDVSDQIEEEEQLLNSTEKNEDAPKVDEADKKKDKGIEMEQDFDADMLDLSDDESDDEDENEAEKDEKLESQMGEEGEKSEVVDEQLWKGEDDKNEPQQQQGKEKQEKDAGMSGAEEEDLEMRAKEENNEDTKGGKGEERKEEEETKELTANEQEKNAENEMDDNEGLKEDDAFEDSTGVKPRVEEDLELPDDLNLDGNAEEEGPESEEGEGEYEGGLETVKADDGKLKESEPMDVDDNASKVDEDEGGENMEEADQEEKNAEDQKTEAVQDQEGEHDTGKAEIEDDERDPSKKDGEEDMQVDGDELQGEGLSHEDATADQPELPLPEMTENSSSDPRATGGAEAVPAGVSGRQGDPIKFGLNEDQNMGNADAEADQSKSELLQSSAAEDILGNKRSAENKSMISDDTTKKHDRPEANANRSLGDALKKWKEMVHMLDESSAPEVDVTEDKESLEEEIAGAAYEYVSEEEAGSAQAFGAATDVQLTNTQGLEPEDEKANDDPDSVLPGIDDLELEDDKDGHDDDMEGVEAIHHPLKQGLAAESKKKKPVTEECGGDETAAINPSEEEDFSFETIERSKENESLVSLRMPHALEDGSLMMRRDEEKPLTEAELSEMRKDLEVKILSGDGSMENARAVWQKLEQMTGRLSQELAEQLRLLLEPTLASKLQGDYRSGKRINMKKIIPYVASQFRKDKIWLRRTKANKRQYQIVLAIDDSLSMTENHCGHMALEALITVCKAMSQLEIGEMAVASFGKQGNVRLLHDFDQPFSTESGLNMISQFTFKQDNSSVDEPLVDLLHYLTRMLDFKARHSTAPSGGNDLQQLVIVIGDGNLLERANLPKPIREAMNRKQLLAYVVLDNRRESIRDRPAVSFPNERPPAFTKSLDSFPFPYYILLQDIESLPRTLADLVRQWFELTQRS